MRSPYRRRTAPAGLKLIKKAVNPWYEVRLVEGRQNQIRIMFKHLGHLVEKLRRVRIGTLEVGTLKPGEFRLLSGEEVRKLKRMASGKASDGNAAEGRAPGGKISHGR